MQERRPCLAAACATAGAALTLLSGSATPALAHGGHGAGGGHDHDSTSQLPAYLEPLSATQIEAEVDEEEAAVIGEEHAEEHAETRLAAEGIREFPQPTRTAIYEHNVQTQREHNEDIPPEVYGAFAEFFDSPDFAAHIAMLPTGKVLLFSFERVETNPNEEPAPTEVIGEANAGRAFLWDPNAEDPTSEAAFEAVPPPEVNMPDGLDEPRPAPFFCSGHAFLPNGMLGVFGGNLGGNHGSGAKLSLIFDPWEEEWRQNPDMSVGRWYPTVVTAADGRQYIFSGQSERGWNTPTPIIERFPHSDVAVSMEPNYLQENIPVEQLEVQAPYSLDYPQMFALNDGLIYGLGRAHDEQFRFDVESQTRERLPDRIYNEVGPQTLERRYGSAVPLPNGTDGPDSVLLLGGDKDDPTTYRYTIDEGWEEDTDRHFGRTQDSTLILPDGTLFTVNGSPDIRDYGSGNYNPNPSAAPEAPDYRQVELRGEDDEWETGPVQRLPRGYHSNAVLLPDGRVLVTGDELQQLANDTDITDDMNGSIEIYEPAYLHRGDRPTLSDTDDLVHYGERFTATTTTPADVERAVLVSPTTATHSINTSQRHLEVEIDGRRGERLRLTAPDAAEDAPPGYYMLFLLDSDGVPSEAQWVQLTPGDA